MNAAVNAIVNSAAVADEIEQTVCSACLKEGGLSGAYTARDSAALCCRL
jgi:hypothetical protein